MKIVFLGLSITSSWGNGHATNYRGLLRALSAQAHDVLFLERDVPWYAEHRDLADPPFGTTRLYGSLVELVETAAEDVRDADLVVVGSYVPEGIAVGAWVQRTARGATAFYDIDTPVTVAALDAGTCEYLDRRVLAGYDLVLSFTGGPMLRTLERRFGARRAVAFHCLVDSERYQPQPIDITWDLGYLGTYGADRQPALDRLLVDVARRCGDLAAVVAGPQYPDDIVWPPNVERIDHLAAEQHPRFYSAQRLTVNVTRADMVRAGWSPSVRLFEAAACGVPVVSDRWEGLDSFFRPGREILIADTTDDVLRILAGLDDERRAAIGAAARARVLAEHTAEHRATELLAHVDRGRPRRRTA